MQIFIDHPLSMIIVFMNCSLLTFLLALIFLIILQNFYCNKNHQNEGMFYRLIILLNYHCGAYLELQITKKLRKNDEVDGLAKLPINYVRNLNYQKLSGSPCLKNHNV